nr:MAG TPA: hypothetical protein [Caudoviricetes sp.]
MTAYSKKCIIKATKSSNRRFPRLASNKWNQDLVNLNPA